MRKVPWGIGSSYECLNCLKVGSRTRSRQKYCTQKCQLDYEYKTGKRDGHKTLEAAHERVIELGRERVKERGLNRKIGKRGYWQVYLPCTGWVYEHHYIWEQAGRGKIPKGYHLHHINGNKLDNRIENLELLIAKEHHQKHIMMRNERGQFKGTI